MNTHASSGDQDDHDIFTDKQCLVLDLLIEHKTSKEIARALGISPYTVDQRISLARAKLGVSSRSELAARYRAMRRTSGKRPSDISAVSEREQSQAACEDDAPGPWAADLVEAPTPVRERQDDPLISSLAADQEKIACPTTSEFDYRVGPEVFEGRSGGLWRLGAIVATALLLVVTILGLFAIFNQLNDMLS
jgi:DNA-binding CsgD family transcriptional regulator